MHTMWLSVQDDHNLVILYKTNRLLLSILTAHNLMVYGMNNIKHAMNYCCELFGRI